MRHEPGPAVRGACAMFQRLEYSTSQAVLIAVAACTLGAAVGFAIGLGLQTLVS